MAKQSPSELTPMKKKTAPQHHWCYVCGDWFYQSIEDFQACGHYSREDYRDHLVKQGVTNETRLDEMVNACNPHKPKPI